MSATVAASASESTNRPMDTIASKANDQAPSTSNQAENHHHGPRPSRACHPMEQASHRKTVGQSRPGRWPLGPPSRFRNVRARADPAVSPNIWRVEGLRLSLIAGYVLLFPCRPWRSGIPVRGSVPDGHAYQVVISDVEGLAREIEGLWEMDAVAVIEERVSYRTRSVLHLTSNAGDFAAKVFAAGGVEVRSGFETLLGARRSGFVHAPQVVPSRAGRYVEMTSAGAVVLMEYLPVVLVGDSTPETWADLGFAVGTLNRISGDRPFAIPPAAALRDQVIRADGTAFAPGVRRLVQRLERLAVLPSSGVIHGEANPWNAGRRGTGELVLLDWDQAGMAASAFEYGYPLLNLSSMKERSVSRVPGRFFPAPLAP